MGKPDKNKILGKKEAIAKEAGDKQFSRKKKHARSRIRISHKDVAHVMVKFINTIPNTLMPRLTKDVMTLRLLGSHPDYTPMTIWQVAVVKGITSREVEEIEDVGKRIAEGWMRKHSLQDSIDNFNKRKLERQVKDVVMNR